MLKRNQNRIVAEVSSPPGPRHAPTTYCLRQENRHRRNIPRRPHVSPNSIAKWVTRLAGAAKTLKGRAYGSLHIFNPSPDAFQQGSLLSRLENGGSCKSIKARGPLTRDGRKKRHTKRRERLGKSCGAARGRPSLYPKPRIRFRYED